MGGSVEKQIHNALGFLPSCGNRCRFSESAVCSSRVRPPSKIELNFKFQNTKVASAKVAFDTSEGFKWGVGSVGGWMCKIGAPHFCLQLE